MGFFVILWVLKPDGKPTEPAQAAAQTDEWLETVGEIRSAFDYVPNPTSNDPVDKAMLRRRARNGPGEKGRVPHSTRGAEGTDPEVTAVRFGKQAAVGGRILFPIGQSNLGRETFVLLDQIAEQIRGHRNVVLVKGHTALDDFPDGTSAQAKMDLSLRRAQAVADYLVSKQVSPDMLRVEGCSTFEPVAERAYNPVAQVINRRVEVEATATLVEELQDPRVGQAATRSVVPTNEPSDGAPQPGMAVEKH
jgi:outer membrane protein OmpA-like peptidoglycan-associated protein